MKIITLIMAAAALLNPGGTTSDGQTSPGRIKNISSWFEKQEWLVGWNAKPDESINRKEFASSYKKNRDRWTKAFEFLKNNDFQKMELKRYDIDGDNVYATISEYITKGREESRFEAHKNYIDIQYVVAGKEKIGISPLSNRQTELQAYDPSKDVEFFTVSKSIERTAVPGRFFIFFPDDAHMPGLTDVDKSSVRKVVVKIKVQ